jgi:ubiquitin-activating enzyme E1 C
MTTSASDGASSSSSSIIKRDASEMSTTTTATSTTRLDAPPPHSRRQRGTLSTLLSRKSPFSNETGSLPVGEFEPSPGEVGARSSSLRDARILVVGAGGLGCEILKDLAMCDGVFRDVVVMDLGERSRGSIRFRFVPGIVVAILYS